MSVESMAGNGSWRAVSSLEELCTILDDSVSTLEDSDNLVPDYIPTERPSDPVLSPEYTSTRLELLSFEYEPDEDEEDTAITSETSPPHPTPSYRSYMTPTGTRLMHTLRKVAATPS